MASYASNSPLVNEQLRSQIFTKYFEASDRQTVNQVFQNIIGTDHSLHNGAAAFSKITISVSDENRTCPPLTLAYVDPVSYDRIVICDLFWKISTEAAHYPSTLSPISCNKIGKTVSDQMLSPGVLMLHEFM